MGWFVNSRAEKEYKTLANTASNTWKELMDEVENNQFVTPQVKSYVELLGKQVNELYRMAASNNINIDSMSITIDGQITPMRNFIIGIVLFMKDFERKTGVSFGIK